MLILQRRIGESVRIGDEIEVKVMGVQGSQVRIGIEAPRSVRVRREELEPWPAEEDSEEDAGR
ncbi:carbon storage regulator CsrA [Halorhodospira halophila]|uniref:carbon storage regulator CsrA n=1 Tax=Halorhodospira halophila TaxID=1053 RepID=UPI0019143D1E|nr:carbon storage regulator CsrA [Halorhodospira halophila]MBK5935784.1 carbon storage regulator [Halorhodospira halophila]